MTNEAQDEAESRWLVEPTGPNEVQFHIGIGEGIQVTDEVRQAIDGLLSSLQANEAEGYGTNCFPRCPELSTCGRYFCRELNNCQKLRQSPCGFLMECTIQVIR